MPLKIPPSSTTWQSMQYLNKTVDIHITLYIPSFDTNSAT